MCGPLSLALPTREMNSQKKILSLFIYNIGRMTTYALLGFLFGILGAGFYFIGIQQQFSIFAGIILFLLALFYIIGKKHYRFSFLNGFYGFIQEKTISLIRKIRSPFGFYLFGIMNGLLPCGMIYMALAASLSLASPGESVLFMIMFGAGTIPAMLLFGFAGQWMGIKYRRLFQKATPFFVGLVAVLLIIRGLNMNTSLFHPMHAAGSEVIIPCMK